MVELNTMLLEHARTGLQTQLDTAVINGDTETARKISADLAKLAVDTAPKAAAAYGATEINAELDKLEWFGVDPIKSARTIELGKSMSLKKHATAAAFVAAVVKAVEAEAKMATGGARAEDEDGEGKDEDGEGEDGEDEDGEGDEKPKPKPKTRRTDAPGEGDAAGGARSRRAASGPWAKMSDAPATVQAEIKRTAAKYAAKDKESQEKYIGLALASHYKQHQQNKARR